MYDVYLRPKKVNISPAQEATFLMQELAQTTDAVTAQARATKLSNLMLQLEFGARNMAAWNTGVTDDIMITMNQRLAQEQDPETKQMLAQQICKILRVSPKFAALDSDRREVHTQSTLQFLSDKLNEEDDETAYVFAKELAQTIHSPCVASTLNGTHDSLTHTGFTGILAKRNATTVTDDQRSYQVLLVQMANHKTGAKAVGEELLTAAGFLAQSCFYGTDYTEQKSIARHFLENEDVTLWEKYKFVADVNPEDIRQREQYKAALVKKQKAKGWY